MSGPVPDFATWFRILYPTASDETIARNLADRPDAEREFWAAIERQRLELAQAQGATVEAGAELDRVKSLLDDFTRAAIGGRTSPQVKAAARAAREEAQLPIIDRFSQEGTATEK